MVTYEVIVTNNGMSTGKGVVLADVIRLSLERGRRDVDSVGTCLDVVRVRC